MKAKNRVTKYAAMPAGQMTVSQGAERLEVRAGRLYRWIGDGVFPTVIKDGTFFPTRLLEEEVEQLRFFGYVHGGQPVRRPRRKLPTA